MIFLLRLLLLPATIYVSSAYSLEELPVLNCSATVTNAFNPNQVISEGINFSPVKQQIISGVSTKTQIAKVLISNQYLFKAESHWEVPQSEDKDILYSFDLSVEDRINKRTVRNLTVKKHSELVQLAKDIISPTPFVVFAQSGKLKFTDSKKIPSIHFFSFSLTVSAMETVCSIWRVR